jgi:hypothetical protein
LGSVAEIQHRFDILDDTSYKQTTSTRDPRLVRQKSAQRNGLTLNGGFTSFMFPPVIESHRASKLWPCQSCAPRDGSIAL